MSTHNEQFDTIFLHFSGAFQPKHVLPYLGGVWGPDGAGQTELSEDYDQLPCQEGN